MVTMKGPLYPLSPDKCKYTNCIIHLLHKERIYVVTIVTIPDQARQCRDRARRARPNLSA